jgi:predicted GIY-YIG superfamily endonuclease
VNFLVYILRCADGSYYTGHADNLEKRVAEHQAGELPVYTFYRRSVSVVYGEAFTTREEALACERRIKDWNRQKKEAMMRGDWRKWLGWQKEGVRFDKLTAGFDKSSLSQSTGSPFDQPVLSVSIEGLGANGVIKQFENDIGFRLAQDIEP